MASQWLAWPPKLSSTQEQELTLLATTYALSHGLCYLPKLSAPPLNPQSAIHAPFALFPTPFPEKLFRLGVNLQRAYNMLYARVAQDEEFLDRVMGDQGVAKVDDFVGQLWKGWKSLRDEGMVQPLQLGLFRSDYLLHLEEASSVIGLKQVEFNTISSSFGALSQRVSQLHHHLLHATQFYNLSPQLQALNLPFNATISGLAEGLAAGHEAYGVPGSRILMVVQGGERNVFDQRLLEYELLERHSTHVIRLTFHQLAEMAEIRNLDRALLISTPTNPQLEISVVYYRAGYTPTDYPTSTEFETRIKLERSRAIKCPSIALQLAGGKKVQEVLTQPGVLESFLFDPHYRFKDKESFTEEDLKLMRETWMEMWGLDSVDSQGETGVAKAERRALDLVLKPQREGGGNNVYKSSIPGFLKTLPEKEREAWIAMELIKPPVLNNLLVKAGEGSAVLTDSVSELGIFGWALFGGSEIGIKQDTAGWILRTKGRESDEGGVAVGFSVLDSVVLID